MTNNYIVTHTIITFMYTCSVASVLSNSLWPYGLQPARFLCPRDSPGKNTGVDCHALLQGIFLTQGSNPSLLCLLDCLLKLMSIELVMSFNHLTLCHPLLLLPSVFPSIKVFSKESALCIRWPRTGVSASASVLSMNIQYRFPLELTVGSPCSPRHSQESSPTPHSKSINSSALSFLYSPTLTSIHDYWKNHSFD